MKKYYETYLHLGFKLANYDFHVCFFT